MKKILGSIIILLILVTILNGCTESDDDLNDDIDNDDENNGYIPLYTREYVAEDVWGRVPAITVDINDVPHISFYNPEYGDLMYATKVGGSWSYEIVDAEGDVGTEKGIKIGTDGTIHIAYKDTTNGDTKYAFKSDDTWVISVLEDVPETHHTVFVDLELDSSEKPHVVYHTESNPGVDQDEYDSSTVKYAVLNGSSWDIERIAPIGQFTQLAMDSNDMPHILYVIVPEEKTIHAYKENDEWVYEEIDPDTGNRRDVDISIDKNDGIHIIYHDTDEGLIKYYYKNEEGMEKIETIDSGLSTSGLGYKGIKLGLDPDGIPHVVYFNGNRNGFVHATIVDDDWTYEVIDETGYPAVVVDFQGRAHVSHTYPLDDQREMAPEVVERDEDEVEQIVYQLIE